MAHNIYICIIIVYLQYTATYGKRTFLFLFPSFSGVSILVSKIAIKFCSNSNSTASHFLWALFQVHKTQIDSTSIKFNPLSYNQPHPRSKDLSCACIWDALPVSLHEADHLWSMPGGLGWTCKSCNKYRHTWIPKANKKGPTTSFSWTMQGRPKTSSEKRVDHDLICWWLATKLFRSPLHTNRFTPNGTSKKTKEWKSHMNLYTNFLLVYLIHKRNIM